SGELINDEYGSRDAVFAAETCIAFPGKFGARDVLHSEDGSVRERADDHILEFRRVYEATLGVDCVLELRTRLGRRLSHLSGGRYQVLFADHTGEIGPRQP